jgi:hypothetical protein
MTPAIITYTTHTGPAAWSMRSGFAMNVVTEVQSLNYTIVAQDRDTMMASTGAPSVSMWPYLVESGQTKKLNRISIYVDKGTSRDHARMLYMNETALSLWREMGMMPRVIGESHRPPRSATLSFGMPFSE